MTLCPTKYGDPEGCPSTDPRRWELGDPREGFVELCPKPGVLVSQVRYQRVSRLTGRAMVWQRFRLVWLPTIGTQGRRIPDLADDGLAQLSQRDARPP